ncbi:MAG: ISKra4 family transposase [Gemmatimonadaceae bacterium]|nr:ISKra4 family transposase [Gemmatimonadaceae bacterium]
MVVETLCLNVATVSAPPAKPAFFPLDDELALLPGRLTPRLLEELVHLAIWMPFAQAAKQLKRSTRVELSEPTVRRQTLAAGAAYVAVQSAQAEHILQTCPPCPCAPECVVVSADGAMVPLRHGEWAEVKTLVIGERDPAAPAGDLHTLSYFSRLSDAASFGDAAVVETHRRGVAAADRVAGVVDGAEWLQGFLDLHCPDAVRILDFPHGVEHVNLVGQAVFGAGTPEASTWLATQRHTLKHEGGAALLSALRSLMEAHPEAEGCRVPMAYLSKRVKQMEYPLFQAAGWPLGSGVVESANKVVVEGRLKGAGMRWARDNVNPMVALRTVVYSDRWDEGWADIVRALCEGEREGRTRRRRQRRSRRVCQEAASRVAAPVKQAEPVPTEAPSQVAGDQPRGATKATEPGRPAAAHPWRRAWSKRRQAEQVSTA